jgi:hypothetical protein
MPAYPIPIGITASFNNVRTDSVATADFTMPSGTAVVTFQPVDPNDPGVATLYDNADDSVVVTMKSAGYDIVSVPQGGKTYYWKATKGANILAMTIPNNPERY